MVHSSTEFLFPPRLIPELRDLRGVEWSMLIDSIMKSEPTSIQHLGFELFIVRLNNCTTCHIDAFRSLRGCLRCARQTISRFHGDDSDLIELYQQAQTEVSNYLNQRKNSRNW